MKDFDRLRCESLQLALMERNGGQAECLRGFFFKFSGRGTKGRKGDKRRS